jgi:hypothetical protein
MAGRGEKKVLPGERLRIEASFYNTLVDIVKDWKRNHGKIGPGINSNLIQSNLTALVRNDTGDDLTPSFQIVRLEDSVPHSGLENDRIAVNRRIAFSGMVPDSETDAIAILQAPVLDGDIIKGVVAGVTVCRVRINDDTDEWANPVVGETGFLDSNSVGQVRILKKSTVGSGDVFDCIVHLIGNAPGSVPEIPPIPFGGGGNANLSWIAGLTKASCLKLSIVDAYGRCLHDTDVTQSIEGMYTDATAEEWIAPIDPDTSDPATINIGGRDYTPTFRRTGTNGPELILTRAIAGSPGSSSYTMKMTEISDNDYVLFSGGDTSLCRGTKALDGRPSANIVRIMVEWSGEFCNYGTASCGGVTLPQPPTVYAKLLTGDSFRFGGDPDETFPMVAPSVFSGGGGWAYHDGSSYTISIDTCVTSFFNLDIGGSSYPSYFTLGFSPVGDYPILFSVSDPWLFVFIHHTTGEYVWSFSDDAGLDMSTVVDPFKYPASNGTVPATVTASVTAKVGDFTDFPDTIGFNKSAIGAPTGTQAGRHGFVASGSFSAFGQTQSPIIAGAGHYSGANITGAVSWIVPAFTYTNAAGDAYSVLASSYTADPFSATFDIDDGAGNTCTIVVVE